LYSIRAVSLEDLSDQVFATDETDIITANMTVSPSTAAAVVGNVMIPSYRDPIIHMDTAVGASRSTSETAKLTKKQKSVIHKAVKAATNTERQVSIFHQKRREKEEFAARKASDRAVREAERDERRRRKIELREQRERFANEQKEAALKRAAELVTSNRVPIEITRGVAAAKAAQLAIQAGTLGQPAMMFIPPPTTKKRSAVMVSTASDLNQIVIHSKNLWAKYNAIAREHNQKVNWITVARELDINLKVREKYARMHGRAEERGFDWINHGHWKIKDHPEVREPRLSLFAFFRA
jgi:Spy/CpxP family protein refolding chaperone